MLTKFCGSRLLSRGTPYSKSMTSMMRQSALHNTSPLVSRGAFPSRNFSKKIEDYLEKDPQGDNHDHEGDLNEDEKVEADEFTDSKKGTVYFFGIGSALLCTLYFMMEVNKVRYKKKQSNQLGD